MKTKKCYQFPDKKRFSTKKDAETQIFLIDSVSLDAYYCNTCRTDGTSPKRNNLYCKITTTKSI